MDFVFCPATSMRRSKHELTLGSCSPSLWYVGIQLCDLYRNLALNTRCFMTVWYVKLDVSSYSHCILGQETIYSTHPQLAFGCVTVHFTFILQAKLIFLNGIYGYIYHNRLVSFQVNIYCQYMRINRANVL